MKLRFFLCALIPFLAINLFAQPAVTRADIWQLGDNVTLLGLVADDLEPGPAGNGVTWDFSTLVRDGDRDSTFLYLDPSGVPDGGEFPLANLAARTEFEPDGFVFVFSKTDDAGVIDYGQTTPVGISILEDPRTVFQFPLGFNDTQNDNFSGTLAFNVQGNDLNGTRTGNTEITYDGFGTLILGEKTFTQVRRMKQIQEVTDTFNVNGSPVGATSITTSYLYLARESGTAILQLDFVETTTQGTTTTSEFASFQDLDVLPEPQPSSRYGAHLTAQTGNFDTEIIVRNTSDQPETLHLLPLETDGTPLAEVILNLFPGTTTRALQQNYFPIDAAGFGASGCEDCVFTMGYRAKVADASTAHVHQATGFKTEYYFYPGEWDLLFDGAAILNAGSDSAAVTLSQLGSDGTLLDQLTLAENLAPGAKYLDVFNGKFENQPNAILKLEASQPLAVMILRISQDNRYLYQNFALPDHPGESGAERWLAHITSDSGGFETSILIHNRSANDRMVTIHPYSADGQALESESVLVPAGWVRRFAKADLVPANTSHAAISGSTDCVVSVGYRAAQASASTAQIHETPPVGNSFTFYPGEWDLLFDGIAIINLGESAATLTATQVDDSGQEQASVTLVADLAPNAKFLDVLEGKLPTNPDTVIRIDSSQPMAILALRLSKDNRYLYGNQPLP